ncbi:MAG: YeiH family protein [Myxococcota bacterium]
MKLSAMKYLFGVALCTFVVIVAQITTRFFPMIGTATVAIVLGVALANIREPSFNLKPGIQLCEKKALEFAVVLLGFQLPVEALWNNKSATLGTVLLSLLSAGFAAWLITRLKPKYSEFGFFLGLGTAICGSSAIAAATPLRPAHKDAAALSIGVINLLGVVGLLTLPFLSNALQFSSIETAALIGGTLQAVGHVAAAAMPLGEDISQLAVPIKMSRVAMLVPTLILLVLLSGQGTSSRKTIKFPWYLYGFMITASNSVFDFVPIEWLGLMDNLTALLINLAMVAIGLGLRLEKVISQISQAAWIGSIIWLFQIGTVCVYLSLI